MEFEVSNEEPLNYNELLSRATSLVSTENVPDDNVIKSFEETYNLEKAFFKMPNVPQNTVQESYKDRKEKFFDSLRQFKNNLLPRVDFTKLQPEYVNEAVETLIEAHLSSGPRRHSGLHCTQDEGDPFLYIRPIASTSASSEINNKVFNLIRENNSQVAKGLDTLPTVSEELFDQMMEYESKIFKIHLMLPPEKRKEFLEKYFDKQKATRAGVSAWWDRMDSEKISVPREDVMARIVDEGLGFGNIEKMKFFKFSERMFKNDLEGNLIPDFVFYLPTNLDLKTTESLKNQMLEGLSDILKGIEEDLPDNLPRYSTPYKDSTGKVHSSLSEAQGDSDFKNYLKRIDKLDKYFDKNKNYALLNSA